MAEAADSARAWREAALENEVSRTEFTLTVPELRGWQAAAEGAGAAPPGGVAGEVLLSGDAERGSVFGGVVRALPIWAWEPPPSSLKLIHAAPATPSESDSARAPTPVATMRRRRCSRQMTAASMRSAIVSDGE